MIHHNICYISINERQVNNVQLIDKEIHEYETIEEFFRCTNLTQYTHVLLVNKHPEYNFLNLTIKYLLTDDEVMTFNEDSNELYLIISIDSLYAASAGHLSAFGSCV